ncbi:MAG: type I-U CRISPR-associated protein Csx17 [Clostridia bacterium]|nr:type I-U CRISPR-associated protein Csx17 [Clostridia bacterium]
MTTRELHLSGCTPEPMLHYLKALGVLRLVSEQKDPEASGYWSGDAFTLRTVIDLDELFRFFLEEYRPTPLIAPWNAGSGFYGRKAASAALDALSGSTNPRLAGYREAVDRAKAILRESGIEDKPAADLKASLLRRMRSELPDQTVHWMDALCALAGDRVTYAPLMGSGGNDGNMEFSNNFMQRLAEVLPFSEDSWNQATRGRGGIDSRGQSLELLRGSLLGGAPTLVNAAIGQFHPGGVGGPNAVQGFEGDSILNPWDYILMFEGALLLAGSVARRSGSEASRKAAFPFTVRPSPGGWHTVAHRDALSARQEIWLPLWERPASLSEIAHLLTEGRAQVGRRPAVNGTDFARAVVGLGIERGLSGFSRFGFLKRKGEGYIGVSLGQVSVQTRPDVGLLEEVDRWLQPFRRQALRAEAPGTLKRSQRAVDDAIFQYCRDGRPESLQDVLITLADAEDVVAHNRSLQQILAPLPGLGLQWIRACDNNSPEFRLASSIASLYPLSSGDSPTYAVAPLRCYLRPVQQERYNRFAWHPGSSTAVWGKGELSRNLSAVLQRRCQDAHRGGLGSAAPVRGHRNALLNDVHRFITGEVDEERLGSLIRAFSVLRWPTRAQDGRPDALFVVPPPEISRLYVLCKLTVHHGSLPRPNAAGECPTVRYSSPLLARLEAGDGTAAVRTAARQVRSAGYRLIGTSGSRREGRLPEFIYTRQSASRATAALLFPLGEGAMAALMKLVLRLGDRDQRTR